MNRIPVALVVLILPMVLMVPGLPVLASAQPDRGWDKLITQVSEEDRQRLSRMTSFEVPEVYELAMVVISLTEAGPDLTVDSQYAREVKEHFAQFKEHGIVKAIDIQSRDEDWYSAYEFRENASVNCFDDDNPNLIVHCRPYSHAWGRQANLLTRNMDLLSDFAEKSGFRQFYADHQAFYKAEVQAWKDRVNVTSMKSWLEQRFPVSEDHYTIIFSPLTDGWHSTQGFVDDDFKIRVMYLQSVSKEPIEKAFHAARIIFTEIDHSHVDTVALTYSDRLNSHDSFGGEFWFVSENGTYDNGFRVFTEYMTWAVFELWARETYPQDMHAVIAEQVATKMTEGRKFVHYPMFRDALVALYAGQAGDSPDIAALYPAILDWAEEFRAQANAQPIE